MKKTMSLILVLAMMLLNLSSLTYADGEAQKVQVVLDSNTVSITNVISEQSYEIDGIWGTTKCFTAAAPVQVTFETETGRQSIVHSENWVVNEDGSITMDIYNDSVEYIDSVFVQYKIWNENGEMITVDSLPEDYFDEYLYAAGSYKTLTKPGVYLVFVSGPASAGEYCVINVVEGAVDNTVKEESKTVTAIPTSAKVLVDGKDISFEAYNINGNNFFKLRDLAFVLNGSEKQFGVGWDGEKNAISLTTGVEYIPVGGELAASASPTVKEAIPTTSKIYLNGQEVQFTAYNIGGNNYFKLRDVGKTIDFGVTWDGNTNTVGIDTTTVYTE